MSTRLYTAAEKAAYKVENEVWDRQEKALKDTPDQQPELLRTSLAKIEATKKRLEEDEAQAAEGVAQHVQYQQMKERKRRLAEKINHAVQILSALKEQEADLTHRRDEQIIGIGGWRELMDNSATLSAIERSIKAEDIWINYNRKALETMEIEIRNFATKHGIGG